MVFCGSACCSRRDRVLVDPDGQSPDTVVDIGFTAYDTGRALGAAAAWAQGKLTGNQTLSEMASEGLRSAGADALTSAGAALVPGLSAGMVRGAKKTGDLVTDKVVLTLAMSIDVGHSAHFSSSDLTIVHTIGVSRG